jgi:hypothetical protein
VQNVPPAIFFNAISGKQKRQARQKSDQKKEYLFADIAH